jgi:hypothetical protein
LNPAVSVPDPKLPGAPSILRARMSRMKNRKDEERQVRKQGVAALERKPLALT